MALKTVLAFTLTVRGDGIAKGITSPLATGPFGFGPGKHLERMYVMPPSFSMMTTVPTAVEDVGSHNRHAVVASMLAGAVTVTYADNDFLAAGEVDTVYGNLIFG